MTGRDVLYYCVIKTHDYSQMGIYSVSPQQGRR